MVSIRVREERHQANVRRKGYPTVIKAFTSREVAKRRIKSAENDVRVLAEHIPIFSLTFCAATKWE